MGDVATIKSTYQKRCVDLHRLLEAAEVALRAGNLLEFAAFLHLLQQRAAWLEFDAAKQSREALEKELDLEET